jgi:hypothetical protein
MKLEEVETEAPSHRRHVHKFVRVVLLTLWPVLVNLWIASRPLGMSHQGRSCLHGMQFLLSGRCTQDGKIKIK